MKYEKNERLKDGRKNEWNEKGEKWSTNKDWWQTEWQDEMNLNKLKDKRLKDRSEESWNCEMAQKIMEDKRMKDCRKINGVIKFDTIEKYVETMKAVGKMI